MSEHKGKCQGKAKKFFKPQLYKPPQTLREKLLSFGLLTNQEAENFGNNYYTTYDFECLLKSVDIKQTKSLSYYNEHTPVSVSVCSNVPEFTKAQFFCEESVELLLQKFITYLLKIQEKAFLVLNQKYQDLFDRIFKKPNIPQGIKITLGSKLKDNLYVSSNQ